VSLLQPGSSLLAICPYASVGLTRESEVAEWLVERTYVGIRNLPALAAVLTLGVVCLASPASVSAGRTFPANVREARAYAESKIGHTQFKCLDALFERESHWSPTAGHVDGAYGIPQSLPGRKMAKFGADWKTNPTTQVKWGLSYISGRYGSACSALSHARTTGWY